MPDLGCVTFIQDWEDIVTSFFNGQLAIDDLSGEDAASTS